MSKKKIKHNCQCGNEATYIHWRALKGDEEYICDRCYNGCNRCEPIPGRDKYAHLARAGK